MNNPNVIRSPLSAARSLDLVERRANEEIRPRISKSRLPIDVFRTQLSAGAVVTAESGEILEINQISYNCQTASSNIQIYIVEDGGTAGNANEVYQENNVALNTSKELQALQGLLLGPGASLQAKSTANNDFNLMVSLTRITQGE